MILLQIIIDDDFIAYELNGADAMDVSEMLRMSCDLHFTELHVVTLAETRWENVITVF